MKEVKTTKKNTKGKKEDSKKKSSPKKKTTVKNEKKNIVKEVEQPKKNWKTFFTSLPFLISTFCILLLVVIYLGVLIYQKEKKKEESIDAHITVPVLKIGSNFEFGVDASLLVKEKNKEYIFKVTNYRGEELNDTEVEYAIVIENPTKTVISLTKEDGTDNLITDQERTVIEGEKLAGGEQKEVYYHLKIDSFEDLKTDDFITIQVLS